MRLLKLLLTGVLAIAAVLAGLVATIAAAVAGIGFLLGRRWLVRRRAAPAASRPTPHRGRPLQGDAIDVEATEIPAEPPSIRQ